MKKEITSFVIGAGIVGALWAGTAFCKNESKNTTPVSEQKINEKQPKQITEHFYFTSPNEFLGNCSWCCGASKKRSRTALFVYRQMVMA